MRLPAAVSEILQGAILFFVLGSSISANYRLRRVKREPATQTLVDTAEPGTNAAAPRTRSQP